VSYSRIFGVLRRMAAAVHEDLLGQLHDQFMGWYAEHGNERLNWAGRGPLGNWHQIENFLKMHYPAAHKGITTGKEQAGHLMDTGFIGDGNDYCPKCEDHPYHKPNCPVCGGVEIADGSLAYETGPEAIARHGYDPKEIAAGMLLLHNRTHPNRNNLEEGDLDRLSEIARTRSQMQPNRQASVYDWKPYTPHLMQLMQDNDLWDGTDIDQRSYQTRSDAGDHYYVRPAGSMFNDLPEDHPHKHTGDRGHWEVDHLPPEYGHDPEGYFGDIYGPTALNEHAKPVDGVSPHGFDSMQHAMDWVQSRHPEESFNPDDRQDPFDPRLIGAGRIARREHIDFPPDTFHHDWKPIDGDPEFVDWHPPVGSGETHASYRVYPDRSKGWTSRWSVQHFGTYQGMKTVSFPPSRFRDYDSASMPSYSKDRDPSDMLGSFDSLDDAKAAAHQHYQQNYTGGGSLGDVDFDRATGHHFNPDDEDYGYIFGMLQRLGMTLDPADIYRLAGDGMSWDDTMRYIDETLAEGEKTNLDDYFNDDYLDGPHPGTLPRPGQHADPDDPICPTCNGPEGKSDPYCPRCGLGEDGDLWQTTIHRAALDMVDLIRLAGDGMSWEDTMAHIDQVLGEGEQADDEPSGLWHNGHDQVCSNCREPAGEHHWDRSCPVYGRHSSGEKNYDDLIGFDVTKFTH